MQDLDRAHPERVPYLLVLMPALVMLGLAAGLAAGVRGIDVLELILALVTTAVALIPLVLDQARRPSERHVMLSTFTLVFIGGFVLPVLVIFIPAEGPTEAPSFSWSNLYPIDIVRGQLATLLGLICLLLGYMSPVGKALSRSAPRFRYDWPPGATLAVAMLIIPLGWAIMLAGFAGIDISGVGSGFVSVIGSSYQFGLALLAIAYFRYRSRIALVLLLTVAPLTSFFGLFTGSKSAMLIPGLMIMLTVVLVRRRIALRWVALAILAGSLVFPVARFVREDLLVHNTLSPAAALRNPVGTLSRVGKFLTTSEPGVYFVEGLVSVVARLDCIGAASVLIRDTPRVAPFQYGKTLGLFFVAFIPRIIWPGKPTITIGRYITDVYGSGPEIESSTAPTQLGEFFINFGYPGIIVGMLMYGILLRFAHEILLCGKPTTPGYFVAVVVLLRLGLGFQGDTANNFAVTVMVIVPIIVAHFAVLMLFPARARPRPAFQSAGGSAIADR